MASHQNSGAQNSNAKVNVGNFVSFTVYAANATTVTTYADGVSVGTYTVGASGALTVTDLADQVSANASFRVVGLVSTTTV